MVCAALAVLLVRRAVARLPLVRRALVASSWMVPTVWINALKVPLSKTTVNVVLVPRTAVLAAHPRTTACRVIV